MKTLKQQIDENYLLFMKSNSDLIRKETLKMLKTEITKFEKSGKGEAKDEDVIKIIGTMIKQRNQTIELLQKGQANLEGESLSRNLELCTKEALEIKALEEYLPEQLDEENIKMMVEAILSENSAEQNRGKRVGQTLGRFMKENAGKADAGKVKQIIESLI